MSQREMIFVLIHAQLCAACRERLIASPETVLASHALTEEEKKTLGQLKAADFLTPERLVQAAAVSTAELAEYANHPVVRLRHL